MASMVLILALQQWSSYWFEASKTPETPVSMIFSYGNYGRVLSALHVFVTNKNFVRPFHVPSSAYMCFVSLSPR